MKLKHISVIVIVASTFLFSCNDDKESSTTDTVTITDTTTAAQSNTMADTTTRVINANGVLLANDQVPDTIRRSFSTKYPRITRSEWYSYTAHTDDDLGPGQDYYYVRFNDNGADYTSWFDSRGDWVKTSTKVPGNKNLPDAVNRYLNVNYPNYDIEEISKENDKNTDMYEIKLNKGDSKVKLKILPSGRLFKKKVN